MINYQKELEKILQKIEKEKDTVPRLYLHSCCAPCSSYVLEYLSTYFEITVFYYNPNISFEEEYRKRVEEQKRLIAEYNADAGGQRHLISVEEGDYEPERFYEIAKGLESCPEGGERCFRCFDLRLRETARRAAQRSSAQRSSAQRSSAQRSAMQRGTAQDSTMQRSIAPGKYDYFATTLTISPLKNAAKLNEIGQALAEEYGVPWLPSDFKKKNGYKRSIELSAQYDLYRQDYCGCAFSKAERERQKNCC